MQNNDSTKPSSEKGFFGSLWNGFKEASGITTAQKTYQEFSEFAGKIGTICRDTMELVALEKKRAELEISVGELRKSVEKKRECVEREREAVKAKRKYVAELEAKYGALSDDNEENSPTPKK